MPPPSLELKNMPSSACHLLQAHFFIGLFFYPEDEGDKILLKVD
jgi:hypothetical protein